MWWGGGDDDDEKSAEFDGFEYVVENFFTDLSRRGNNKGHFVMALCQICGFWNILFYIDFSDL